MKNKLFLSVIVFALVLMPVLSLAETEESDSVNSQRGRKENTIKSELESKKEAAKNSIEDRRQNALNKIEERIDKFVQNVTERFDAAVNRLEKLADRIDSRIAKMEAKNVDVSKAKELLIVARAKIEIARTSTANISSDVSSLASSTATSTNALRDSFQAIKVRFEKAKNDIKEAHAALVDVVNNLKPGYNKLKNSSASSTTETEATTTKESD